MKIPSRFNLMGHTIKVEYQDDLVYSEGSQGLAKYAERKIVLQPRTPQTPTCDSNVEQVFCHELVHHLLELGAEGDIEPPLHMRECLVDRLGSLVHQALSTFEFEE